MNKRVQQKGKTHDRILSITNDIYLDQGYINASTKSISKKAGLSQGTIFLHFETKEKLFEQIVVVRLNELFERLHAPNLSISTFFKTLIDEEAILARVLKDYPYLPQKFQEAFDQVRMIYKDLLFDLVKPRTDLSILDLFSLIEMVLALIFEDLFYSDGKVMSAKVKKYKKILDKYT